MTRQLRDLSAPRARATGVLLLQRYSRRNRPSYWLHVSPKCPDLNRGRAHAAARHAVIPLVSTPQDTPCKLHQSQCRKNRMAVLPLADNSQILMVLLRLGISDATICNHYQDGASVPDHTISFRFSPLAQRHPRSIKSADSKPWLAWYSYMSS